MKLGVEGLRVRGTPSPTGNRVTYGNLEIHHLLGKCRHFVVEAELVLADALGSEDEVTLALLGAVLDDLAAGRGHGEIDIEGTAGLDLHQVNVSY